MEDHRGGFLPGVELCLPAAMECPFETGREGGKGRIRTGDYRDGAQIFTRDSADPAYVTALSERTRKEVRGRAIGELG
jgi:hypothetical protein